MKIILTANVPKLGKKWEVKEVAAGYARNYLFKNQLAKAATAQALLELESLRAVKQAEAERELAEAGGLVSRLDGLEVEIPVKVGENGALYSSVNSAKISEALTALGFDVKKEKIKLSKPLKEIGEYPTTVVLGEGLEAEIRVLVVEEKPEETKNAL
jgi:large subunit ribosomal protein L9